MDLHFIIGWRSLDNEKIVCRCELCKVQQIEVDGHLSL